jgi:hypothetical protein
MDDPAILRFRPEANIAAQHLGLLGGYLEGIPILQQMPSGFGRAVRRLESGALTLPCRPWFLARGPSAIRDRGETIVWCRG